MLLHVRANPINSIQCNPGDEYLGGVKLFALPTIPKTINNANLNHHGGFLLAA